MLHRAHLFTPPHPHSPSGNMETGGGEQRRCAAIPFGDTRASEPEGSTHGADASTSVTLVDWVDLFDLSPAFCL